MSASLGADGDCPAAGAAQCSSPTVFEFAVAIPTLMLVVGYFFTQLRLPIPKQSWTVVVDGVASFVSLPKEVVMATKIWSAALLVLAGSMLYAGVQLSVPLQAVLGALIVSGFFIEYALGQTVFHISTSCGWVSLFDVMMFAGPEQRLLSLILSSRGLLFSVMISGIIIRIQHGNQWQYKDPSHMMLGYLLILCYFWVIELPACSAFASDQLCSAIGHASNLYLHGGAGDRVIEIVKMAIAHAVLNGAVYLNTHDVTTLGNNSSLENQSVPAAVQPDSCSPTAAQEDITRRFSGATDTEDDNQVIMDDSGEQRKLPRDCVEITEAEAIEIIQNGLNSFKKKRAT